MTRQPTGSRRGQQAEFTDHQAEKKDVIQNERFSEENVAISPKAVQNYDHSYPGQLDQYLTEKQKKEGHGRRSSLDDTKETSKREHRQNHHDHKKGHHHRHHSSRKDHHGHSHSVDGRTYPTPPCMSLLVCLSTIHLLLVFFSPHYVMFFVLFFQMQP
jgi:hypothetical protein